MASFPSSFDPCKRSATAAAATAPAASGMVCGNVNNSQEEKYKLHSEIFLHIKNHLISSTWELCGFTSNYLCEPISLCLCRLMPIIYSFYLLLVRENADLCWSKTKPRCQGACAGWFWKVRRANTPVNEQALLTIWLLQWCKGANWFWLNEARSLHFLRRICCPGRNILQKKYVNF